MTIFLERKISSQLAAWSSTPLKNAWKEEVHIIDQVKLL